MKTATLIPHALKIVVLLLVSAFAVSAEETPAKISPDKPVYGDYQNWRLLSISHRLDKQTLRAILGNDTAIDAARKGNTKPWPDGTIITKVAWKEKTHPNWSQAVVPDTLEKAEAMVKDQKKYEKTGGWGFAKWEGNNLTMYDEAKSKECFACHLPMQFNDYVYNAPALQ
jgi:hypothetical protein